MKEISAEVMKVVRDLELTATLPSEMMDSQKRLIDWCENKIAVCRVEEKDMEEAYNHALNMGWKSGTLKRQHMLAVKKIQYYWKLQEALQHGYCIVPNFDIQMFAVRTTKNKPLKMLSTSMWGSFEQDAEELPIGEGEYKNPFPLALKQTSTDEKGKETIRRWAEEWDEFEFPITMAKPIVMDMTSRAMQEKIFDRIGVFPKYKKDDPVIIGQIIHKANSNNIKVVSFMIAWHLNTKVL